MNLLQIHEPGQTPEPHAAGAAIGIDLGTTHSVVAYSHKQTPHILPDAKGHALTPSIVHYGQCVTVGREAAGQAGAISSIKRLMGRSAEEAADLARQLPYETQIIGEQIRVQAGKRFISPIEISADILRALKTQAENVLDDEVTQAVITVPAYFDDRARAATKEAARLAGLDVLRLINEPTAAALAYGLDEQLEGTFAIYDLGGGTFDITILKLAGGVFKVLATAGDTALGGDDIDHALASQLYGAADAQHLRDARQVKHMLSDNESIDVNGIIFTRAELNALAQPFIERTLAICQSALRDAKREPNQVDAVILVGGSTRMPLVHAAVAELFGKTPLCSIDPDLVVAMGAAIQAEALTKGADHLLLDVIPLSLSLETMGGMVEKLIYRNTPIPTSAAQEFTTYQDGQTAMKIHVLQGEREMVAQNRSLAEFTLRGIPPLPANIARIRVTFSVDADGILTVSAEELITGMRQQVEVTSASALSLEEMEAMLRDSMEHAKADILERLLAEARLDAERSLQELHSALAVDADLLSNDERAELDRVMKAVEIISQSENRDAIDAKVAELHHQSQQFAQRRMDKAIATALQGKHVEEVK